jgi:hypothetical protein
MISRNIILFIILNIALLSCNNKNKFVGRWASYDQINNKMYSYYGFNIEEDDGKFIVHFLNGSVYVGKYNSKENCIEYKVGERVYEFHYLNNSNLIIWENGYYKKLNPKN